MAKTNEGAPSKAPEVAASGTVASQGVQSDPQYADILAKLAAAEAKIREQDEELAAKAQEAAAMKVRPDEAPFAGENAYRFSVGPLHAAKYPQLQTHVVEACDESEAIRWYCMTQQHPAGSGKRVDPVKVQLVATCLDKRRAENIMLAKRIAAVRRKLESGSALSKEDNEILDKYEGKVLGYDS